MKKALNQMTTPTLGYAAFLDLAKALGCCGVEVRNDLGRPLFDGIPPSDAGQMAAERGLRILGVSQVYPFNSWSAAIGSEVRALIDQTRAAGGETISLIPRNDGTETGAVERRENLARALSEIRPMLIDNEMTALVEPLGFGRSSLRSNADLVEAIDATEGRGVYKLVHDTFHHALAGGGDLFPELTGIVHISGVAIPGIGLGEMEDAHRVLVDENDRLGNVEQIAALLSAGYQGAFSCECFSPDTHALSDPLAEISRSFGVIEKRIAEPVA